MNSKVEILKSGIYIHFPFCLSKCIYCNFFSIAALSQKEPFLKALRKEISFRREYLSGKKISTLYFGGGTPSLFTADELQSILNELYNYFDFSNLQEFTIEVNPEQLTPEYLSQLRNLPINRISIGIQSFDDQILQLLRRRHSVEMAMKAIDNAFNAGFENLSIDLIYGIDARSTTNWEKELRTVFSFPIKHLSAYALTVEENTLLYRKKKKENTSFTSEDTAIRDFEILAALAHEAGFEQYEISNFAKSGHLSLHNSAYWQGVPYLGLGPSAHSYNGSSRQWNVADINYYIVGIEQENPDFEIEYLTPSMKLNEYILLSLRTSQGLNIEYVESHFGKENAEQIHHGFSRIDSRFFILKNGNYILSYEGKFYADYIAGELFF